MPSRSFAAGRTLSPCAPKPRVSSPCRLGRARGASVMSPGASGSRPCGRRKPNLVHAPVRGQCCKERRAVDGGVTARAPRRCSWRLPPRQKAARAARSSFCERQQVWQAKARQEVEDLRDDDGCSFVRPSRRQSVYDQPAKGQARQARGEDATSAHPLPVRALGSAWVCARQLPPFVPSPRYVRWFYRRRSASARSCSGLPATEVRKCGRMPVSYYRRASSLFNARRGAPPC